MPSRSARWSEKEREGLKVKWAGLKGGEGSDEGTMARFSKFNFLIINLQI